MKSERIYLSPPDLTGKEIEHLQAALQSNWIAPAGHHLDQFEDWLSQYFNQLPVVALNSGTSAIHLALKLLGVSQGDEVICPSFTFVATTNPVMYEKATPILVDSEPDTWNMCPEQLEQAIKDRLRQGKKPKAIIVVHLYGQPAKMTEILAIAQQYKIPVIEDAAEALGSLYQDQKVGTLGHLGVVSFNGNKIVTTSAGGALITQESAQAKKALFWSTQSKDTAPHYQHSELGYNYRLSNILAAIGLGQVQHLQEKVNHRRWVFDYYRTHLPADLVSFQTELSYTFSNRWLTCIVLNPQKTSITLSQVLAALETENIEARPLWKPLHLQPLLKAYPYYGSTVCVDLFRQGLCLPSGSNLQESDLNRIVSVINKLLLD